MVNLVPDTCFFARYNNFLYPMCCAIEQTITPIGIYIRSFPCIAEWNTDLPNLSLFRNIELWPLIICFHRLYPAWIGVPLSIDLIPGVIERVAWLAIFIY